MPGTILPNNLDTETKASDCTPKDIYVEIIKMTSHTSQNITPHPSHFQGTPAMYNLNANNSGRIKIENAEKTVSEFTTRHFLTLAFPVLFPYVTGDFHVNRPRTCTSLADWANHLLWDRDNRFGNHQLIMIMTKRFLENSTFILKQKLGDDLTYISKR